MVSITKDTQFRPNTDVVLNYLKKLKAIFTLRFDVQQVVNVAVNDG